MRYRGRLGLGFKGAEVGRAELKWGCSNEKCETVPSHELNVAV